MQYIAEKIEIVEPIPQLKTDLLEQKTRKLDDRIKQCTSWKFDDMGRPVL